MRLPSFLLWLSWKLKYKSCLECGKKGVIAGFCDGCLHRYHCTITGESEKNILQKNCKKTRLSVFVATPWSQKLRKKWYRYKFLKDYRETALFVALLMPILLKVIANASQSETPNVSDIWLTHPPARPQKVYPWARIVQRLAVQQGWHYEPNLLAWESAEASVAEQKKATSKRIRQQQRASAFCATTHPPITKKLHTQPPRLILLLDDMMTTGATVQGCLTALHHLIEAMPTHLASPQIKTIVLTEVPL